MSRFSAFVKKEFRHILRDRRTLLILFGMPVVQVLLFGFVLSNEIKDAGIVILDQARDENSLSLTNALVSSGYFKLVGNIQTPAELEPAFRSGKVKLAVVFPGDFSRTLQHEGHSTLQLIGDASDPNTAATLIQYATAIVNNYQQRLGAGGGLPLFINTETRMQYNPEQKAVFNFVPGVMTLILMLVAAMMTSITIAKEKELGTMEVLLVSPLRPLQILLGKTAPYLVLSCINAMLIILMGVFVFGMPLKGSPVLLALQSILYMFVSLSLGIFISTRASNQMTAMFMSALGLLMPTMLLSGFIFPRESMPIPLQIIGYLFPATWFIPIVKGIMIKGTGIESFWQNTVVLLGMAVGFMLLGLKNFKIRLA